MSHYFQPYRYPHGTFLLEGVFLPAAGSFGIWGKLLFPLSVDHCSLWEFFLIDFAVFWTSLFLSALSHAFPAQTLILIFTWSELSTCWCSPNQLFLHLLHLCQGQMPSLFGQKSSVLSMAPQVCTAPPKSGCLHIVSLPSHPSRAPHHGPSCPSVARATVVMGAVQLVSCVCLCPLPYRSQSEPVNVQTGWGHSSAQILLSLPFGVKAEVLSLTYKAPSLVCLPVSHFSHLF